jgi:sugar phosphate isomerase/epimerase
MRLPENFSRLIGTLGIGKLDLAKLAGECREMRELGYYGVYFNDIFFTMEPLDCGCVEDDILYAEDTCLIVRRPMSDIEIIKSILNDSELKVPSSHFLNVLPEPGMPVDSVFASHERILDIAAAMEMSRVTTHIGGIAVPRSINAEDRPTPAELLVKGEIDYLEYAIRVKELYGGFEKILEDSVVAYRHLTEEAAKRDISVSIETACGELLEVNKQPEAIIDFINKVGADNMGICLDSGHCHLNGLDTADIVRRSGNAFIETHFHDNFGVRDRHNPVGIGTLNWLEVIKAMNEIGYLGEITFEQGDYKTNHQNWTLFLHQVEKDLNG